MTTVLTTTRPTFPGVTMTTAPADDLQDLDRFTLDPLTGSQLAAVTAMTILSADRTAHAADLLGEATEWTPAPAPTVHPVRFTITRAGSPSPALLERWPDLTDVFVVSAHTPTMNAGPGGPDTFGVATTREHAHQLARVWMATPPPSRRHGFMITPAGALVPLVWESRHFRRRFIRSLTA